SIMAEVLLNELGGGRFKALSAGPRPAGSVHPMALRVLREAGHNTEELASKGWHHFARPDSPRIDLVVTVCDSAAREVCPVWSGRPATIRWSFPDPAAHRGRERERHAFFTSLYRDIRRHVEALVALPDHELDALVLGAEPVSGAEGEETGPT
ncbi:MAG: arsenate reductase ArsC, partial [Alphaproteobacteria bacterium]